MAPAGSLLVLERVRIKIRACGSGSRLRLKGPIGDAVRTFVLPRVR
jgi:hypothetical protein